MKQNNYFIYFGYNATNEYLKNRKTNIVTAIFANYKNNLNTKMVKKIYSGVLSNLVYIEVNGVMLDLNNFSDGNVTYDFPEDGSQVKVNYKFKQHVDNLDNAFMDCDIKSCDFSKLDTTEVLSSANVFKNCKELASEPVLFDLSNSLNVSGMFDGCDKLVEISLGDFKLGKAENMASMFNGCVALESVADFDMSSANNVTDMFTGCDALAVLEITNAPVSNVDMVMPKQLEMLSIDQTNGGAIKYFVEHITPKPLNIEDSVTGTPIVFDTDNVVSAIF